MRTNSNEDDDDWWWLMMFSKNVMMMDDDDGLDESENMFHSLIVAVFVIDWEFLKNPT